jgi:hypothetical protein
MRQATIMASVIAQFIVQQLGVAVIDDGTTATILTNFKNALLSFLAPLASPAFTGTPTAPTPTAGDNSTKLATTGFIQAALAFVAPKASPTFTGIPAAPTAVAGTNNNQLATTAFVYGATQSGSSNVATVSGTANAIVLTLSPGFNPVRGTILRFNAAFTNTGPVTITCGSVTENLEQGGSLLSGGELVSTYAYEVYFDGATYVLFGSADGPVNVGAATAPTHAAQLEQVIISSRKVCFSAPGTYSWIAPAGITNGFFTGSAGGGSGGCGPSSPAGATGGGGGGGGDAVLCESIALTPGTAYTIIIGSGGAAISGHANGNAGSATSFANGSTNLLLLSPGGAGGLNGASGAAGSGGGGNPGASGQGSNVTGALVLSMGGSGGGSLFGAGGAAGIYNQAGQNASGYGAGGGGGTDSLGGGGGAGGFLIIEY